MNPSLALQLAAARQRERLPRPGDPSARQRPRPLRARVGLLLVEVGLSLLTRAEPHRRTSLAG